MTIREMITQGLYYARTCRSLWLFGFIAGVASSGSNGGGGGGDTDTGRVSLGAGVLSYSATEIGLIAIVAVILTIVALIVIRFVAEGALIEGVVRARQGGGMTTGEGFRAGWAHFGVLLRIAALFLAATIGSVAVLVPPCVILFKTFGLIGVVVFGIAAFFIVVPWLVTLYLVQAFAWRIAVLENRHALDAIRKARLFLHGRLAHALKLLVATFVGTLGFGILGTVLIAPVVLVLVALIPVVQFVPAIVIGSVVLLPVIYVLAAMMGTFRSSVWTIGYVTQVES